MGISDQVLLTKDRSELYESNPILDDDETDSDDELAEALASGAIKPGLVVEEQKRTFINNTEGLLAKCQEFSLGNLDWIQRLDVTSDPLPPTDATMVEDSVPNDDFKREMRFHRQAQASVLEGLSKLAALDVPTKRPEDYFAEMAKSDHHMKKIRTRLLEKKLAMERSEKVKKLRETRKYGKKVQMEVMQKRQKEKREMLDTVKKFRKGQVDKIDMFNETIEREKKGGKDMQPNKRREFKNKKFGFGGQKKRSKYNTAESAADISGFNADKTYARGRGKKTNKVAQRPGKSKRKMLKNKKK